MLRVNSLAGRPMLSLLNAVAQRAKNDRPYGESRSQRQDRGRLRRRYLLATVFACTLSFGANAHHAEPALNGAMFNPSEIVIGETTALTVTYANSGSTPVPISAIELSICPSQHFFEANEPPKGTDDALFAWSQEKNGCWTGVNSVETPAFGGGTLTVLFKGLAETKQPHEAKIQVKPTKQADKFNNHIGNDVLTQSLNVTSLATKRALVAASGSLLATDPIPVPFAPWWWLALAFVVAAASVRRHTNNPRA